uniref:Uncharacterized protein n=1 Tax=Angiostrongylus cantonensis TaxID=6313 RepID=A0A0K0DJH5_ANGCA
MYSFFDELAQLSKANIMHKKASLPVEYGSFERDAPLNKIQLDVRRRCNLENTSNCGPLTWIIGSDEDETVEMLAENKNQPSTLRNLIKKRLNIEYS